MKDTFLLFFLPLKNKLASLKGNRRKILPFFYMLILPQLVTLGNIDPVWQTTSKLTGVRSILYYHVQNCLKNFPVCVDIGLDNKA